MWWRVGTTGVVGVCVCGGGDVDVVGVLIVKFPCAVGTSVVAAFATGVVECDDDEADLLARMSSKLIPVTDV